MLPWLAAMRLVAATNPESGTTSYDYTAGGRLLKKTDAAGRVVCMGTLAGATCTASYDNAGRPLAKSYSDGTAAVSYGYTNAQLTSVNNAAANVSYIYDLLGRTGGFGAAATSGRGAAMIAESRARGVSVWTLFCIGIGACALGLSLAGSMGHRIALAMGVPFDWFRVDFIDPRASRVAIVLQVAFIAATFFGLTKLRLNVGSRRLLAAAALANPGTVLLGFVLYRLLPLGPEAAYVGPASFVVVLAAFPVFLLVAFAGIRGS